MSSPNTISPSPCSRLNEDVLREIFIHCTENPFRVLPRILPRMSIRKYPQLSVSRVCASWRHAALLTSHIWNDIYIYGFNEANLSIARGYLSRAGNLPISIMLFSGDKTGDGAHHRCSLLAEFLSSYRLRSLMAFGEMADIYLTILPDLPQRSLADLEQLELCHGLNENGLSIDLDDIRYLKLAVIKGSCKVFGFSSLLRAFHGWDVVTTVTESWDILSSCPSLEKCCFKLKEEGSSPDPASVPRILLQHLDTLQLRSERTRILPFSTFIEALALPNLEDLSLEHPRVAWSPTAFQSFAKRSNHLHNLRQFVLEGATSDVDAGPILASMPSIISMHLCYYDRCHPRNQKAVFDHLTLNSLASGSLAPQLQTLWVGYMLNVGEFMDMVESRMKNARMSSNGVPAPFALVQFRDRNIDKESDHLQWGVRIIRKR